MNNSSGFFIDIDPMMVTVPPASVMSTSRRSLGFVGNSRQLVTSGSVKLGDLYKSARRFMMAYLLR